MQKLELLKSDSKPKYINSTIIWWPTLLLAVIVSSCLFPEYAFAGTNDTLKPQADIIENFLTGNVMRGIAIAGNIWGLVQSYMKSSVMVLSGVIGIDLIGCGMLAWVKSTWALVI